MFYKSFSPREQNVQQSVDKSANGVYTVIKEPGGLGMQKPKSETRYEQVYKKLRAYILENNLKPGDALPPEQTLCEQYGVSRNILREALKGLTLMGVISGCPGKGNVLQPFSCEDIMSNALFCAARGNKRIIPQLLDVRKKLELSYMREAFQTMMAEDIRNIRAILERIKSQWAAGIYFHADDKDFHMALFSRIDNQALHDLMVCIWSVDESFQVESKMRHMGNTIAKHEAIVRALEDGNQEAFEAAMLSHFSSGKYAVGHQTASFDEPQSP